MRQMRQENEKRKELMKWQYDEYKDLKHHIFDSLVSELKIEDAEKISVAKMSNAIDNLFKELLKDLQ
jgi:hypothetical protein